MKSINLFCFGFGQVAESFVNKLSSENIKINLSITSREKTSQKKINQVSCNSFNLEDDRFDITGITDFQPGKPLTLIAHHSDGCSDEIVVNQSYNHNQIEWFKSGSALNCIAKVIKRLE